MTMIRYIKNGKVSYLFIPKRKDSTKTQNCLVKTLLVGLATQAFRLRKVLIWFWYNGILRTAVNHRHNYEDTKRK